MTHQIRGDAPAKWLQIGDDGTPVLRGCRIAVENDDCATLPALVISHALATHGHEGFLQGLS